MRKSLTALGVFALAGITGALSGQAIVAPATSASPAPPTAHTRIGDRSIAVRLRGAERPGTVVELRNLLDRTITSVRVDSGSTLVLPAPWNGELTIAAPGRVTPESVAVVVEPLVAGPTGDPARLVYGPGGWSSVRFRKGAAPPAGTQVVITTPPLTLPPSPPKPAGDLIEVGLTPSPSGATTGVIGLTPWSPAKGRRLVVTVYDPVRGRWTPLPSRVGRDGTVFASGPLPGVYALTAAR